MTYFTYSKGKKASTMSKMLDRGQPAMGQVTKCRQPSADNQSCSPTDQRATIPEGYAKTATDLES